MKILTIGNDQTLFEQISASRQRAVSYSQIVTRYDVVTVYRHNQILPINDRGVIYGIRRLGPVSTLIKLWFKAVNNFKNIKYDIVSSQDPFEFGLIAYLISKQFRCGLHVQEHGDFFGEGSKNWQSESLVNKCRYYVGIFVLRRADSVRVVSQRVKESLIKIGVDKNKIVVVPVAVSSLKYSFKEINETPVILMPVRLVKQKNFFMAIEIVKECLSRGIKLKLIIIGTGPEKSFIQKLITHNNLNDIVNIRDWTTSIETEYAQADFLLLTSWYEGWARTVIEAAWSGVTVIMTRVGCADEVIKNDSNGVVVNINDHRSASHNLIELIKDHVKRKKLTEMARKTVEQLPSFEESLELLKNSWFLAIKK